MQPQVNNDGMPASAVLEEAAGTAASYKCLNAGKRNENPFDGVFNGSWLIDTQLDLWEDANWLYSVETQGSE